MKIKPDHEEYYNGVKAYIWDNNGVPSIKINRKIKGKDGKYRYVDYFRLTDMPNILKVLELAESYMSAVIQAKGSRN